MKIRDIILRALAKKIRWWRAAEIIRASGRTTTSGAGSTSTLPAVRLTARAEV
jgi:hypothetical protein